MPKMTDAADQTARPDLQPAESQRLSGACASGVCASRAIPAWGRTALWHGARPRERGAVLWRWLLGMVVVLMAAGAAWQWYSGRDKTGLAGTEQAASAAADKGGEKGGEKASGKGAGKGGGRFGDPANRVTPVSVATIAAGDLDVYLNALGTVTPLRTVTVRTRVDGELVKVLFREGQLVREGELLAEIDPRPFLVQQTQMEGQVARDEALLANARIDLERYRTLFAQDSIAKQLVDTQASLVRQLEGTVRMDAGQLDNVRLQLTYARITAPISGRIGLRQVDQGNIVHASDANGLAVITQTQPVAVIYTIPQDSLPGVMRRQTAAGRLPAQAWDREQKRLLARGSLTSIDNQIDVTTGTVRLKAQFDNRDGELFPNQFVNVRMLVDTLRAVVIAPAAAVQRGVQGLFVYVAKDDNTVAVRVITTGANEAGRVEVTSGLAAGERVVVDGMDRLREGAKIEIIEAGRQGRGGRGGKPEAGARTEKADQGGKADPGDKPPRGEGGERPDRGDKGGSERRPQRAPQ